MINRYRRQARLAVELSLSNLGRLDLTLPDRAFVDALSAELWNRGQRLGFTGLGAGCGLPESEFPTFTTHSPPLPSYWSPQNSDRSPWGFRFQSADRD